MSMPTPPGWYPDPDAPGSQRWWDGSAWTEHRQAAQLPQNQGGFGPTQSGFGPAGQGFATAPQPMVTDTGSSRGKVIALTVAGAVLVAAITVGALVLGEDDGGGDPTPGPTTSAPATPTPTPTPSETRGESAPPAEDPTRVTDQLNGITLPIVEGWEKAKYVADPRTLLTAGESYDCPSGSGLCRYGTVSSRTAADPDERDAKTLATQDIEDAAEKAYGEDALGSEPYNGIKSHREVKSGQVAVAGRSGWFVRWRVTTGAGEGGYIQSVAFPSSTGSESMVLVRIKIDAADEAPSPDDMDKIVQGIRAIGDETGDGGVGSTVEPKG